MALKKENKASRDKKILDDYRDMFFKHGKREEVIFNELGVKYFLEPITIARIIRIQISKL